MRAARLSAVVFAVVGYALANGYFYWADSTAPHGGGDGLSEGWGYFCFAPCFWAPLSALLGSAFGRLAWRRPAALRVDVGNTTSVNGKDVGRLIGVEADVVHASVMLVTDRDRVRLQVLTERDAVEMAHALEEELGL